MITRIRLALSLCILAIAAATLGGCRDAHSVLAPGSDHAEQIEILAWILFIGGTMILLIVIAIATAALLGPARMRRALQSEAFILLSGLAFPIIVLTCLLAYGTAVTGAGPNSSDSDPLEVTVIGEQWWWRVIYHQKEGGPIEAANELRIPTGRSVKVALKSADVIHSFWVPALAGKVDTIPGRTNFITLAANRPGVFRGLCAEYCGGAHAFMGFHVVSLDPDDFEKWFARERSEARLASTPSQQRGRSLFLSKGCGACHTVRGTRARGTIGPDLTHIGSRQSIAAATLANNPGSLVNWIRDNQHIKPGNLMLNFESLATHELNDIASYLENLE